jgi:hypothetical protein
LYGRVYADSFAFRLAVERDADGSRMKLRLLLCVVISLYAGSRAWLTYSVHGFHSDYEIVHFAAQALRTGHDPYPLIGPGLSYNQRYRMIYPAPSIIAAIPFSWVSARTATAAFIGVTTFLLAFGVTRRSYYLLPLFLSEPFTNAATIGQWSILATAVLFLPMLAVFSATKPQALIPAVLGSRERTDSIRFAVIGGLVLILLSLILIPRWPAEWIEALRVSTPLMGSVLVSPFGWIPLLALLRWRRRESWLILSLALIPQTYGWYSALPLMTIPRTWNQSIALAFCANVGAFVAATILPSAHTEQALTLMVAGVVNLTIYLPAVVMVLMRPNESLEGVFQTDTRIRFRIFWRGLENALYFNRSDDSEIHSRASLPFLTRNVSQDFRGE